MVFIFLVCPVAILSQNQKTIFNNLTIEHGLSQNMIRSFIQDSRGFMWIATWDGLNRYDGYNFKVYKNIIKDPRSLRVNKIKSVIEDHNGAIWVGTYGGGLSKFNPLTENFTNYMHNPKDKNSICSDRILTIFEDSRNRIWIGTEGEGLSVIDNETSSSHSREGNKIRFVNFKYNPKDSKTISNDIIRIIMEDSFGNIWFGADDSLLNKIESTDNSFRNPNFIKFNPPWQESHDKGYLSYDDIVEDKNHPGILWLVNFYQGLIWFDINSGKFYNECPTFKLPGDLPKYDVQSCYWDNGGNLWLGTSANGIYLLKHSRGGVADVTMEQFTLNPFETTGKSVPNITGFYEDKSGLIWIGTFTNGLYTYFRNANRFVGYFNNYLSSNSLGGKDALSCLETRDGKIWIGTESGLDNYNPATKKYTHYKHNPVDPRSISDNTVYSLYQDIDGTLWVGTAVGLDKFNPSSNSFSHYKNDISDPKSINVGEIIKIFSDSKGSLWIGSWKGGLNKLVPGTSGGNEYFLHYVFDKNDPNSISDDRIMSMAEDSLGQLWIGTSDGGLNKLISDYSFAADGSIIPPKFKRYKHDTTNSNSLSNNDVRALLVNKTGVLWIGTLGNGISRLVQGNNGGEDIFIHYDQKNGLANDVVRGLLEDSQGNLWIGTARGLSRFDPAKNLFWNFYEADGLHTNQFEDVSYKSKINGMLYFGGINGVISFNPRDIRSNEYVTGLVITSLNRYNTDEGDGITIEEKGIPYKKEIVFSYDDNILTFEFAALSFHNSDENIYAYKLNGYNDNWIQLGTKRDVTFTNLDPGEYTLQVKAANNDGVWNEEGISLHITVLPPWWRSNWAFLFYASLILTAIFTTDRIMRRRVTQKERDKAKLREAVLIKKQAQDLETVDSLVRVINNAADLDTLFNSLLEQTVKFIPRAEKAAIFILDHKENLFNVAFTSGYKVDDLEEIKFMPEELHRRYTENSDEIEKGIYILNDTNELFGNEKLAKFSKAKSMLVMAVEWDNRLEAYVVFDNFKDRNAFDPSTARLLNRFREHAVSAISKAQTLKTLQDKNEEIIRTQEQLIVQQKLASLGALTAGIAHEIKNPLNFVNNFAELSSELLDELTEILESEKENLPEAKYSEMYQLILHMKDSINKINNHGTRADNIIKGM
ncbi:MAG: two-component regulator propeller domain-containing protein [bacterium]